MSLTIRKLIVIAIIGAILLTTNIMIVGSWLQEQGVIEAAGDIRKEFLTGTAITVIIALLILLVGPKRHGMALGRRRCPVCDHGVDGSSKYCPDCGSKL